MSSAVPLSTRVNFVLIAYSEPWRADQLCQLVVAVSPGTRVQQVNDGQAALEVCKREIPSLLIADGELDGLDGVQLLRELRRHASTQRVRCILISERKDAASVRAILPLAPSAYLGKPCDMEMLRLRLEKLLPHLDAERIIQPEPLADLDGFLERMRENNRGAPLLEPLQAAVSQCLEAEQQSLGDLEAVFARDPQITARLISVANSASQHQGVACQTLAQALPRLGVKRTLNLVLELALQRNARLADPRLAEQAGLAAERARAAARLAEWLARRLKLDAELCFTAGLLHNIGDLALLRSLQDWLDGGGELDEAALQRALRERAAGFGSALRTQWRLPLGLRQLVRAFYSLGAEAFTSEALVLNLSRLLLELPADADVAVLANERAVRMLRIDPVLLQRAPRASQPGN